MKITSVLTRSNIAHNVAVFTKSTFAKVATLGLIAGALAFSAPAAANAQVSFGVRVGHPVYYGHAYVRPYPVYGGYYAAPAPHPYFYGRERYFVHGRAYWR